MALWLATLPPGQLAGRVFDIRDDLEWVEANAAEIEEQDLYTSVQVTFISCIRIKSWTGITISGYLDTIYWNKF